MRGATCKQIQELAGHSSLLVTQRYMHLSPGATRDAIDLLELPRSQRGVNKDAVSDVN
jgi:site-specific recombinase XerD